MNPEDDDLHCGCDYPCYCEAEKLLIENEALKKELDELKQVGCRKYLPTLGELLDRLTITQIKEVKIVEHKDKYAKEIEEIVHDINLILSESGFVFNAEMLRALVILAQYNLHIWHNESNFRKGIKEGNDLELTHGLNSIRNCAKNMIQDHLGGRKDYKLDNVAAFPEWVPSW